MIIGHTLNGAIRTTYLRVTFPFHAASRMLYRGARGIVLAIERVYTAIKDGIVASILATGRGIRRTVFGIGSSIAFVFRSMINAVTKTMQIIGNGFLSVGRAIARSMGWTRHMIVAGAILSARLATMPFVATYRTTGSLAKRVGIFIGAKYRAFVFSLASTTMTLSLEDGHARLLVLKGDRIIAWRSGQITEPPQEPAALPDATTELRPKAVSLDEVGPEGKAEAPVVNPLESLLEGLPARSKHVITDLPLYVPLLRHIPLPDVKGRFLKEIVSAEVLDSVPFAQDEVDIQWRIEQGDGIKEASVIAVPRDRMNSQIGIIRDSHLAPSAVYSRAASLAAAVARPDVFILHMTKAQTAVVLVREGVPRIVHRLDLPGDTAQQAEAIAMGVGQVAGYHRSQRPEDDVGNLPVVVTGEVDQVQELVGLLSTALDRPVHPFEPSLESPEGFNPAEYASNIGLFLASRSKESAKLIAAQNVLPERHRPRPLPVVPAAVFAALLALVFLAFNLTGWVSGVAGELDLLNAKLDIRKDQEREYRLSINRQGVIDQRISDVDLEAADLEANLLSLEREMEVLLARISDIIDNADSSNVELSRLVPIPEGFQISGGADSNSDVLKYAESIRSSPNFEDAAVLQVGNSTGARVAFTIKAIIPTSEGKNGE